MPVLCESQAQRRLPPEGKLNCMRSRKLRATAISGAKPASAALEPPEKRPHGRQPRDSHTAASWIDYANMGLMVLALGVASIVPFELFLISYAVLGPLHYLTEISWLHDRRFFLSRRTDWLPLFACTGLITLANPAVVGSDGQSWLNGFRVGGLGLAEILQGTYWDLTFLAFATALVFVLTSSRSSRLLGVAIATAAGPISRRLARRHGSLLPLIRRLSADDHSCVLLHGRVHPGRGAQAAQPAGLCVAGRVF